MNREYFCENKEPEKLYKIGMFANMNHVTVKTLRHYENVGLLEPFCVDEGNGYRYYTSGQLSVLHQILALRKMGFSLEEIKKVQQGIPERSLLMEKKIQLMQEIAERTSRLAQVECYLEEEKIGTEYHVLIKELPEVIVASMRRTIPGYDSLFDLMPSMGEEMERLGCECACPEYCFSIYYDAMYKEENVDLEICEAVTEKKQDSKMLQFKVIPRVEMAACIMHRGPYDGFPEAYGKVIRFVEENGYEIAGNPRESYIDGVWNKESPGEWLSEIQFPVRKK